MRPAMALVQAAIDGLTDADQRDIEQCRCGPGLLKPSSSRVPTASTPPERCSSKTASKKGRAGSGTLRFVGGLPARLPQRVIEYQPLHLVTAGAIACLAGTVFLRPAGRNRILLSSARTAKYEQEAARVVLTASN